VFEKLITYLGQKLADTIIEKMIESTDEITINHLYEFGMMLDSFYVNTFGIYLD